ncbi:hypothetical protein [Methylobacterium sp. WSM2598]|uniref:hypothetical protein n=1 Tax=Methylobacterium sp. WSM2598 TaxID=398261 RepID=UPI0012F7006E|nr:hypothetical protein [Methylobacterium sp. WSM2598]
MGTPDDDLKAAVLDLCRIFGISADNTVSAAKMVDAITLRALQSAEPANPHTSRVLQDNLRDEAPWIMTHP